MTLGEGALTAAESSVQVGDIVVIDTQILPGILLHPPSSASPVNRVMSLRVSALS